MRRIGVDVGGTFTDLILVDEAAGAITIDKVPSTPDDPARAVMTGVDAVLRQGRCELWRQSTCCCTAPPWRPTSRSNTRAPRSA